MTSHTPPLYLQTPVYESLRLGQALGKNIQLKMECLQPTGSFKARGISALCQEKIAQGSQHLVSSSGGNAGYTTAFVGRQLGVQVTVFVPTTTSALFIEQIRLQGAEVIVQGEAWDDSHQLAMAFAEQHQGALIPPFDHPTIWAGHSTLVDELVTQIDQPDAILVSVGGGGLLCGILAGLHKHGWQAVKILATETQGTASLAASMQAGQLVTLDKVSGIATTLAAKRISEQLWQWTHKHSITPVTVSDAQAEKACQQFARDHRILVEPACGAALAPLYEPLPVITAFNNIVVIVCGGIGVTTTT